MWRWRSIAWAVPSSGLLVAAACGEGTARGRGSNEPARVWPHEHPCQKSRVVPSDCESSADDLLKLAPKQRFYFDPEYKRCERFAFQPCYEDPRDGFYGFSSQKECEVQCPIVVYPPLVDKRKLQCHPKRLPRQETLRCTNWGTREAWFWDPYEGECRRGVSDGCHIYSGFESKQRCEEICEGEEAD
jgi:hypothetical protein